MNQHHGRVVLLLLFFLEINIYASTYQWSASINKTSAVVNEAVHLKYICKFSDNGELYNIDFNPVSDSDKYKIVLLKEDESLIDGKLTNTYEYIAYPKVEGAIAFNFDVGMKKTTQESINYTTKSRDDDRENEDFTLRLIPQKVLELEVKYSNTKLVGDFELEVKKEISKIHAYEPYHLDISIQGIGNLSDIQEIKYEIDGVKIFTQKPTIKMQLTENGEEGIWNQKFAFVGEKDFKIPQLKISYYSLEEKKIKEMLIEGISLELKTVYKKEQLLDEEEEYQLSFEFLYYIFSFIAGFLVAKIKIKGKNTNPKNSFNIKIEKAKTIQEIAIILATSGNIIYKHLLYDIDNKKIESLGELKKKLKDL